MKRKYLYAFIASIMIAFVSFSLSAHAANTDFKVTIDVELTTYSHLGKDLVYNHTYNGYQIRSGDTIHVSGSTFTINTEIIEEDSIPDTGEASVTFSTSECLTGSTKYVTTTVHEVGGKRYPRPPKILCKSE